MEIINKRQQQVLCDKKWQKLVTRTWLFKHIPFIEFVFGSGSLAIGNVDLESDFDVLIGAAQGRIFTARFCTAIAFGIFGWRRKKMDHHDAASDKICLNHFVTPSAYTLRLLPNAYWRLLYQQLVPVYGSAQRIQTFFDANSAWAGERVLGSDLRYKHRSASLFKQLIETLLGGTLGHWLERKLKAYQVRRIERGLHTIVGNRHLHEMTVYGAPEQETVKLPPLTVYTDEELEFHPDPAVIELRA